MKLGTVGWLIPAPKGADPARYHIEKTAELGLKCLGIPKSDFADKEKDRGYLEGLGKLARERGVELLLCGIGGNFSLDGAAVEAEVARAAETVRAIAAPLGVRVAGTACGPMNMHRWAPGKPIPERIAHVSAQLGKLADAVADTGVTISVENHCDYRGHEIAEVVERANRPNLKVQLDTGNPFSVFEEPVDCARVLARHVVSVHLKDIHVTPFANRPCPGARAVTAPLGEGHVDNVTICRLLQEQSPDPASLALMIEPFFLPEAAEIPVFLEKSVAWARKHLADFLGDM
ncbi:MAG: sugar phosphate isomerase/epimerase family protein [Planctomycetota bacterium]